jgi:hypothetical protein
MPLKMGNDAINDHDEPIYLDIGVRDYFAWLWVRVRPYSARA